MGIEPNARAWRLWDRHSQRIFVTGDAVFRENIFPAAQDPQSPSISSSFTYPAIYDSVSSSPHITDSHSDTHNLSPITEQSQSTSFKHSEPSPSYENPIAAPTPDQIDIDSILNQEPDNSPTHQNIRRSSRVTAPPTRYGFATSTPQDSDHPTYTQAMASPDKAAWLVAMQEEFDAFTHHSVGTLVDPPPGANILGGMWIFTQKRDEFNRVCRFKARWVVFGNHQIKGLD